MFTSAVDRAIVIRSHLVALLIGAGLGCRGETPAEQAARGDSALIARTWGLAYLQQGQLTLAETQFRAVVRLAPREPLGYADLGLVFLREGRYSDAEAQLRRAASLDSTSSDVDLMLAEVYRRTGRDAAARAAIDQALRADSTDIRALYAIGDLHRVLAHAPANIVARLDLTSQLLSRSRSDSAAGELEALQRQLPRLDPAAARAFTAALQAARAGRATESEIGRAHV